MEELMEIKEVIHLDKWLIAYLFFVVIDLFTGLLKAYKVDGLNQENLEMVC